MGGGNGSNCWRGRGRGAPAVLVLPPPPAFVLLEPPPPHPEYRNQNPKPESQSDDSRKRQDKRRGRRTSPEDQLSLRLSDEQPGGLYTIHTEALFATIIFICERQTCSARCSPAHVAARMEKDRRHPRSPLPVVDRSLAKCLRSNVATSLCRADDGGKQSLKRSAKLFLPIAFERKGDTATRCSYPVPTKLLTFLFPLRN